MSSDINRVQESFEGVKQRAEEINGAEALTRNDLDNFMLDQEFSNLLASSLGNIEAYREGAKGSLLSKEGKNQDMRDMLREVMGIQKGQESEFFLELAKELGLEVEVETLAVESNASHVDESEEPSETENDTPRIKSPEVLAQAKTKALRILTELKTSIKTNISQDENASVVQSALDAVFQELETEIDRGEPSIPPFSEVKNKLINKITDAKNKELDAGFDLIKPKVEEGVRLFLEKTAEVEAGYGKAIEALKFAYTNPEDYKYEIKVEKISEETHPEECKAILDSIPDDAWDEIPAGQTESLADLYYKARLAGETAESFEAWRQEKYPLKGMAKILHTIGRAFEKLGKFLGPLFDKIPFLKQMFGGIEKLFGQKKKEIPESKQKLLDEIEKNKRVKEWNAEENKTLRASFDTFRNGKSLEAMPEGSSLGIATPMKELLGFVDGTEKDLEKVSLPEFRGWEEKMKETPALTELFTWAADGIKNESSEGFRGDISRETWNSLLASADRIEITEVEGAKEITFKNPKEGESGKKLENWSETALQKVLGIEKKEESHRGLDDFYEKLALGVDPELHPKLWEGEENPKKFIRQLFLREDMKKYWKGYKVTDKDLTNLETYAGHEYGIKDLDKADIGGVGWFWNTNAFSKSWFMKDGNLTYDDPFWPRQRFNVSSPFGNAKFRSVEAFFKWMDSGKSKFNEAENLITPVDQEKEEDNKEEDNNDD